MTHTESSRYRTVDKYQSLGFESVGNAGSRRMLVNPWVCLTQDRFQNRQHVRSNYMNDKRKGDEDNNYCRIAQCGQRLKADICPLVSEMLFGCWCQRCLDAALLYFEKRSPASSPGTG